MSTSRMSVVQFLPGQQLAGVHADAFVPEPLEDFAQEPRPSLRLGLGGGWRCWSPQHLEQHVPHHGGHGRAGLGSPDSCQPVGSIVHGHANRLQGRLHKLLLCVPVVPQYPGRRGPFKSADRIMESVTEVTSRASQPGYRTEVGSLIAEQALDRCGVPRGFRVAVAPGGETPSGAPTQPTIGRTSSVSRTRRTGKSPGKSQVLLLQFVRCRGILPLAGRSGPAGTRLATPGTHH